MLVQALNTNNDTVLNTLKQLQLLQYLLDTVWIMPDHKAI